MGGKAKAQAAEFVVRQARGLHLTFFITEIPAKEGFGQEECRRHDVGLLNRVAEESRDCG